MDQFIIWTVQRTGGTNFATNLIKLSGLPITAHEPLNVGRPYGYITKNWQDTLDRLQLDKSLSNFLDGGYPIKHCVENVDWEINESLAIRGVKRNLFHIILYRENALDRLLSLHFASETGLWGRKKVFLAKQTLGAEFKSMTQIKALEVDKLINHEKRCSDLLMKIARIVKDKSERIFAISFEEIYEANEEDSNYKISKILGELGISDVNILNEFLSNIRGIGGQGSKNLYKEIHGSAELAEKLIGLTPLRNRISSELPDLIIKK